MTTASSYREQVRDWVGSSPDDPSLDAAVQAFLDEGASDPGLRAALRILRRRRADNQFSSFSVTDDVSWNQTAWLADLDRRVAELRALIGDDEQAPSTLPPMGSAAVSGPGNQR